MSKMRWMTPLGAFHSVSATVDTMGAKSTDAVIDVSVFTIAWKRIRQAGRHGLKGSLWLFYVFMIAPVLFRALVPAQEVRRQLVLRRRSQDLERRFSALQERWRTARPATTARTRRLEELSPELDQRLSAHRKAGKHISLALIHRNGPVLPLMEPFWETNSVSAEDFLSANHHNLLIVDLDGYVGVLKNFRKCRSDFVNELEAALSLHAAHCNVPDILQVDFEALQIVYSYIPGTQMRDAILAAGVNINHPWKPPGLLSWRSKDAARMEEARRKVPCLAEVDAIGDGLNAIHRAGYTFEDVKYGNVIIEQNTGIPIFIDFESASCLNSLSASLSRYMRDRDAKKLNDLFGTNLLTAATLRKLRRIPGGSIYAPIYVGQGIRWGAVWNPDVGIGRWRYIMARHLSVPTGGRILDLGANNGFNALQMLRAGAAEVVAIELDPRAIEQGLFLKRVWEWHDNSNYQLKFVQWSHGNLRPLQLGRFDQVTAFCTLYYLPKVEMIATVQYLREISCTLVQQANTDRLIPRQNAETFEKASLEFAVEIAAKNGFPEVQVVAPSGYSRPLVIAKAVRA
jgi:serine/threonine protein kinase